MDEKFGLPEVWNRNTQQRTKTDQCSVCESPFSMVAMFGVGNRDFFCKQCGMAVCGACSQNKKFLSRDAKEKFRVCDMCDTKLDNNRLRLQYDKFIQVKDDKLKLMENMLKKRKEHKKELKKDLEELDLKLQKDVSEAEKRYQVEQENNKRFLQQIEQLKLEQASYKK